MADLYTVALELDPTGMVSGAQKATNALDKTASAATRAGKAVTGHATNAAGALESLGATAMKFAGRFAAAFVVGAGLRHLVTETIVAQNSIAQLNAALESTAGVSGQTTRGMEAYARTLQRTTAFSDDAVMAAQSVMLAFTNIGGNVFPRATKAAADLATRMGGDLQGSVMQLGKALNDPTTGMMMLNRAGVQLSGALKANIIDLQAHGQLLKAQELLLSAVERKFAGAAAAARNTFGGALSGLKNAFGDLFEVSREGSSSAVNALNGITHALEFIKDNSNAVLSAAASMFVVFAAPSIQRAITSLVTYNASLAATTLAARAVAASELTAAQAAVVSAATFQASATSRLRAMVAVGAATEAVTAAQLRLAIAENAVAGAGARLTAAQQGVAATTTIVGAAAAGATASFRALWAAMLANPITAVLVAAVALNTAIDYYISRKDKIADAKAAKEEARQIEEVNAVLAKMAARRAEAERVRTEAERTGAAARERAKEESKAILEENQRLSDSIRDTAVATAKSARERTTAIERELDVMKRVDAARKQGTAASEALRVQLAGEAALNEYAGKDLLPRVAQGLRDAAEARERYTISVEHSQKALDALANAEKNALNQTKNGAQKNAETVAEAQARIVENLTRGTQSAFAEMFNGIFNEGLSSFGKLWDSIKTGFFRLVSEMLAASAMRRLAAVMGSMGTVGKDGSRTGATGIFAQFPGLSRTAQNAGAGLAVGLAAGQATGSAAGGALIGAASGFAVGGPVGAIVGGISGLVSGLAAHGARVRAIARQYRDSLKEWERNFADFADIAASGGRTILANATKALKEQAQVLSEAAFNAFLKSTRTRSEKELDKYALNNQKLTGNIEADIAAIEQTKRRSLVSNELQKYLDELYKLRDAYKTNAEAVAAAFAIEQSAMNEDLRVRELLAQGRNAEAEAMRFQLQQERELAEARRKGFDTTQLEQTQAVERDAFARLQAEKAASADGTANGNGRDTITAVANMLTEGSASRILGELTAIRIATRQTADALNMGTAIPYMGGKVNASAPVVVNFYGTDFSNMEQARAFGAEFVRVTDKRLGTQVQARDQFAGRATMRAAQRGS